MEFPPSHGYICRSPLATHWRPLHNPYHLSHICASHLVMIPTNRSPVCSRNRKAPGSTLLLVSLLQTNVIISGHRASKPGPESSQSVIKRL
ncbi:hypothetical protein PGT21_009538 [Puccinia graminis f. sp. tritici]|uniref:Uncharacterized protein n=1 Tax=Puccinia graminis f. sp. tritici TaxID=56615 RepID=A0A5B0ND92_PUCGR|nr:hypothetical protein PGT21_009538 [Puccinia graminis f. sp. tritici]